MKCLPGAEMRTAFHFRSGRPATIRSCSSACRMLSVMEINRSLGDSPACRGSRHQQTKPANLMCFCCEPVFCMSIACLPFCGIRYNVNVNLHLHIKSCQVL